MGRLFNSCVLLPAPVAWRMIATPASHMTAVSGLADSIHARVRTLTDNLRSSQKPEDREPITTYNDYTSDTVIRLGIQVLTAFYS